MLSSTSLVITPDVKPAAVVAAESAAAFAYLFDIRGAVFPFNLCTHLSKRVVAIGIAGSAAAWISVQYSLYISWLINLLRYGERVS